MRHQYQRTLSEYAERRRSAKIERVILATAVIIAIYPAALGLNSTGAAFALIFRFTGISSACFIVCSAVIISLAQLRLRTIWRGVGRLRAMLLAEEIDSGAHYTHVGLNDDIVDSSAAAAATRVKQNRDIIAA